ncbi:MAG: hypothetical protein AAF806_12775, partial [Bacteroidota bacterium]
MYRFYYLVISALLCFNFSLAQNNQLPLFNLFDLEVSDILNRINSNQKIRLPFPNGETIAFQVRRNDVLSEKLKNQYSDLL